MDKNYIKYLLAFVALFVSGLVNCLGQSDTGKHELYADLSLEDLLNVKIVSVSKKAELLFDAPLSATVITKDDIRKAGSTSIMEALRLVPGAIVREQSNGNYDINLRGMDNVPPNGSFDIATTTTLVMIDSRPIYSYLRGGTFWETLPIDINDVEKIEVIRGPAAALYGPNAVNGVINIITRQPSTDGLYIVSNAVFGSNHTIINNAAVGYKARKWSIVASGNYQDRDRAQTSYYEFNRNAWFDHPDYLINFRNDTDRNIMQRFPHQQMAMRKRAANIFLNYNPNRQVALNLSAGIQHSMVQKVSAENENTPLSTSSSDSRYIDFRASAMGFNAQVSYNRGTQNVDYDPGNEYNFHTFDGNIEYNFSRGDFSLKPGLSYKSASYDDTRYSNLGEQTGIFNAKGLISSQSASLRGEYKLLNSRLRLVAGVATNSFNYPDTTYISYQFAATFKAGQQSLFRLVYSSAPRSSNIFDTYANQTIGYFPTGYRNYSKITLAGNKNLKLLTANMIEAGFRGSINQNLHIDVEVFDIRSKNHNLMVQNGPVIILNGQDTIHLTPIMSTNLPLTVVQQGVTVSLDYSLQKLQVKPFVTIQQTRLKDYAAYHNSPDATIPGAAENNIYSGMGKTVVSKSTPAVFGGGSINYMPVAKFNCNLTAYYYTGQTYYHLSNILFNDGLRGIDHLKGKLIVNATLSYELVKGLHLSCSGKNILNDPSREFFRSDDIPFMLMGGIHYEL